MRVFSFIAAATVVAARVVVAATLHIDTFDTDLQGWSAGQGGTAPPTHVSTGPNAGYLRVAASEINSNLAALNMQSAWTGDFGAIGASLLKVSMMVPTSYDPLDLRVVLFGPTNLSNRWTSTDAAAVPNDGEWHNYIFSLAEEDLTPVFGTGTYAPMMAGVVQVMLRHNSGEPSSGGTSVGNGLLNFDDVELATLDVPPTPGDFNGDGDVDAADLDDPEDGFKTRFGMDLEGADILEWQQNLYVPGAAAALAGVPEPTTLVGCGAALLFAALGRRRI